MTLLGLSALGFAGCIAGCKAPPAAPESSLFGKVKAQLAARDQKLTSYSVKGRVVEGDAALDYAFHFRAPGRMKGELLAPTERTYSFDGKTLFELDPKARTLSRITLEGPRDQVALALSQVFSSFVSEGYRVPLLLREGVTVERVSHPRAPEAVKLTQVAKAEGSEVTVTYVLRWPACDFLEKTMSTGEPATAARVAVEAEHCDAKLGLCVPSRLTQYRGGARLGSTEFTQVVLDAPLPQDDFTLSLPEGFTELARSL